MTTRVGVAVDSRAIGIAVLNEGGGLIEAFTVRCRLAGSHTPEHPHDDPRTLTDLGARAIEWLADTLGCHGLGTNPVSLVIDLGQPTSSLNSQPRRAAKRTLPAQSAAWARAVTGGAFVHGLRGTGWSVATATCGQTDSAELPESLVGSRPSEWARTAPKRHTKGGDRRLEQAAYLLAYGSMSTSQPRTGRAVVERGAVLAEALRRRATAAPAVPAGALK